MFVVKITPELVRIHAHLCGDGQVTMYTSSEKDRKNGVHIAYYNTNPELIAEFRKDMAKVFGVKMKYIPKRYRVSVQSMRIGKALLKLSNFKTYSWRIPQCIKNASEVLRAEWIKAFAKDEGYMCKDRSVIRIKSMNVAGLQDVVGVADNLCSACWLTGKIRIVRGILTSAKMAL